MPNKTLLIVVVLASSLALLLEPADCLRNPWGYVAGESVCVTRRVGVWLRTLDADQPDFDNPVSVVTLPAGTELTFREFSSLDSVEQPMQEVVTVSVPGQSTVFYSVAGLIGIPKKYMAGSCDQSQIATLCDITNTLKATAAFNGLEQWTLICFASAFGQYLPRSVSFSSDRRSPGNSLTPLDPIYSATYWGLYSLEDGQVCFKDQPGGYCNARCSDLFDPTASARCLANLKANYPAWWTFKYSQISMAVSSVKEQCPLALIYSFC